jgi:hypothetical protein
MLREAPQAAGPNRDSWPYAGHVGAAWRCTKLHHLQWAQPGPLAARRLRKLHIDTAHLCTARSRTLWEPLAAIGPEELCDSEWSHGCRHDALTVFFQSSLQVTVEDS